MLNWLNRKLRGTSSPNTPARDFAIPPEQIKPLVPAMGSCIATDKITRDAEPVGWMYRDQPDGDHDSGWRFFSGTESEGYANNPDNLSMYDVNTIANYDADIIPHLNAPVGSAFARDTPTTPLRPADPPVESD